MSELEGTLLGGAVEMEATGPSPPSASRERPVYDAAALSSEGPSLMHVRCRNKASRATWGANPNPDLPDNLIVTSKYTFINFIPKNLCLQFQKVSNIYFFVNMCFALIPGVSPVVPVTTIAPLLFVVGVAMLRDAYEDIKRHKEDSRANSRKVKVLDYETSSLRLIASREVHAGDILCLDEDQEVPADILLLSSGREDEGCYIETANLDGETNLKKKSVVASTKALKEAENFNQFAMHIACESPSPKLSAWDGLLTSETLDFTTPVDLNNIVLRGCYVRQTSFTFGMAVYTGVNTKMSQNLTKPPVKISRIDQKLSKLIQYILAAQQLCILLLTGGSVYFAYASSQSNAFYIKYYNDEYHVALYFVKQYLTYFVLLALMMPISLFLSIEFCKLFQAKFMEWDLRMYDEERDLAMKAKTASLNEELSQVQTICSDKTGTLTENKMLFASAYVSGNTFDELRHAGEMVRSMHSDGFFSSDFFENLSRGRAFSGKYPESFSTHMLLQSMAACSTLIPSVSEAHDTTYENAALDHTLSPVYQFAGDSTDEVALALSAQSNGYVLTDRTDAQITLRIPNTSQPLKMTLLCTLPFSSERKMMSVIVRHPSYGLVLLTKGSDAAVMARCEKSDIDSKVEGALHNFACSGLRTLCFAWKPLREAAYTTWRTNSWDKATATLHGKQDALDTASLEMERNMLLIGATGIEDKLQDGVPETIAYFKAAAVVIWVLTGDKKETAVNIGKSSNVISASTVIINPDVAGWRAGGSSPPSPGSPMSLSPLHSNIADKENEAQLKLAHVRTELNNAITEVESFSSIPDPYGSPPYARKNSQELSSYNSFASLGQSTNNISHNNVNNGNNGNTLNGTNSNFNTFMKRSKQPSFRNNMGTIQSPVEKSEICLLIDGLTLEVVFGDDECRELFTTLSRIVGGAICCRVTPIQKAEVVGTLQGQGITCLGVGDGANDVSMIQRAKVGVGIMGLEGSQAERSSDYSIPRFRHLVPLLAVHGRYALLKNSYLIQYSFYKNLVYALCQIAYSAFAGFTGQTLFDSWVIINYNMIFTLLPPLVMGLFEYDVDGQEILRHPMLYYDLRGSKSGRLSRDSIVRWLVWSVVWSFQGWAGTLGFFPFFWIGHPGFF